MGWLMGLEPTTTGITTYITKRYKHLSVKTFLYYYCLLFVSFLQLSKEACI